MISAYEALERLRAGNARFVAGNHDLSPPTDQERRAALVDGQEPFAVILGCADSRVPAELVFDQGLGDLFVVRVAGNLATPSQIGSIEFAAAHCGTRLVVVMGHTHCGAVGATYGAIRDPGMEIPPAIGRLAKEIRPAFDGLLDRSPSLSEPELLAAAGVENVRLNVQRLQEDSTMLAGLMKTDGLVIVGAEYQLETGEVRFLDGSTG